MYITDLCVHFDTPQTMQPQREVQVTSPTAALPEDQYATLDRSVSVYE